MTMEGRKCPCSYDWQLFQFPSLHCSRALASFPRCTAAMAELRNMQPRSKMTSTPYYQERAHCRSQGFNLFVPVSAQD